MQQLEISQQIVVKGRRRWAIFHHKNCRTKKRSIHAQNKNRDFRCIFIAILAKNQARKGPDGSASLSVLQHFADNLYRFFFNQLAMLFAEEAFAVDLVGVFGA